MKGANRKPIMYCILHSFSNDVSTLKYNKSIIIIRYVCYRVTGMVPGVVIVTNPSSPINSIARKCYELQYTKRDWEHHIVSISHKGSRLSPLMRRKPVAAHVPRWSAPLACTLIQLISASPALLIQYVNWLLFTRSCRRARHEVEILSLCWPSAWSCHQQILTLLLRGWPLITRNGRGPALLCRLLHELLLIVD